MKVSFIIPNYNHARYVRSAIDSALAQTYGDSEIVVVDDGSTDNSRAVLAEYGERIRVIFQANAGLSAARNTGIQAAKGEYIALLDADDMLEPAYAERLLAALAAHPQADGAYCGFRFVDQEGCPLPRTEQQVVTPAELYAALLNGNYWVPESLLIRRECYLALGEFDTTLRACEDWDVWLRFSRQYHLVGIDDVLVRYRVVGGSMSSNPQRMLDNRLRVLGKHVGAQPSQAGDSATHRAYASAYLRSAVEFYQYGDAEAAYACLLQMASVQPQFLCVRGTYYELASSRQERGSEGEAGAGVAAAQQTMLEQLIERLADETAFGPDRAALAQAWKAQALWALVQLSYRAGDNARGRRAWRQASQCNPALLRDGSFLAWGVRVGLGAQRMARLKRLGRA